MGDPLHDKMRRTTVHVDRVLGDHILCTPGGVDLPEECLYVHREDFPEAIRSTIEPGKVFFARVNLSVEDAADLRVADIEDEWGNTDPIYLGDGKWL